MGAKAAEPNGKQSVFQAQGWRFNSLCASLLGVIFWWAKLCHLARGPHVILDMFMTLMYQSVPDDMCNFEHAMLIDISSSKTMSCDVI